MSYGAAQARLRKALAEVAAAAGDPRMGVRATGGAIAGARLRWPGRGHPVPRPKSGSRIRQGTLP
jgi:hypothetical protein